MIKSVKEGCQIVVKVTPKASSNKIVGWEGQYLKIKIHALPEKGNANEELIRFLSEALHIAKSHIQLIQGSTSRIKRLLILNLSKEQLEQRLSPLLTT